MDKKEWLKTKTHDELCDIYLNLLNCWQEKKKQLETAENNWEELARHLNPDTCKPIYWDYMTAQKTLEAKGELYGVMG